MLNFLFTQTPLKFLGENLWRDEAFSVLLAKKDFLQILYLSAKDFSPPLYHIILHWWMMIFGMSEVAVRSLSLLFFWGTIYAVFLFLTNILKLPHPKSLLYLLLFAFNPLLLFYAMEARMYTMFAFLATLSFYAFYRKDRKLYIISTILGLFTHYFMVFVVFAQIIYRLWEKQFAWKDLFDEKRYKKRLQEFYSLLKPFLLPLVVFLPWLLYMLTQKSILGQTFWIERVKLKELFYIAGYLYTGYEKGLWSMPKTIFGLSTMLFEIFIVSSALIWFGVQKIKSLHNNSTSALFKFLLVWAFFIPLLMFFGSYIKPLFLPRYLIFSTIGLLLLTVMILEHIKLFPRFIFIALLTILTIQYHQTMVKKYSKTNPGKLVKEIATLAGDKDVIYVTNELDFHVAQYYFEENRVFIYGKSYNDIPAFVGKALIPPASFHSQLPTYPARAFILKDNRYEIQSMY